MCFNLGRRLLLQLRIQHGAGVHRTGDAFACDSIGPVTAKSSFKRCMQWPWNSTWRTLPTVTQRAGVKFVRYLISAFAALRQPIDTEDLYIVVLFSWRASSAMSTAISQLSRFQVWRIIFFDNILPNKKCSSLSKLLCYSFTSSTHNLKLLSFLNYPAYLDPKIVMKTVFPRKGPIFKQSPITFNTVEIKEIERIDGPKSEHFLKHKMFRSWYEHSSAI